MALVIMNGEVLDILAKKQELFISQVLTCYLYQNNHTPGPADTLADYDQATFPTYAGINILWNTSPQLISPGKGALIGDSCIWHPPGTGGPNSLYGYFVVSGSPARLEWAEKFEGGPITVNADSAPFTVIPYFREESLT